MTPKEGTEVSRDIDPRTSNEMDLIRMTLVSVTFSEVTRDIDPGASDVCLFNIFPHITNPFRTSDGAEKLASLKIIKFRCPRNLASRETMTRTPVINDSLVYKLLKLISLFKSLNIMFPFCCSQINNLFLCFYSLTHTTQTPFILKDTLIYYLTINDLFSDISGACPGGLVLSASEQGPPCLYVTKTASDLVKELR